MTLSDRYWRFSARGRRFANAAVGRGMPSARSRFRALGRTRLRTLARACALALLLSAWEAQTQSVDQAVRKPPAWPTPEEYLANRNRAEGSAVSTPEPAPMPAVLSSEEYAADEPAAEKLRAEESPAQESPAEEYSAEESLAGEVSPAPGLPPFALQLAAFRRYPLALAFAGQMPVEGVETELAVIARLMSRTFTLSCIPPQEPMRISVLAP